MTETTHSARTYWLEVEKRLAALHATLNIERELAKMDDDDQLSSDLLRALEGVGRAIETAASRAHCA